MSSSTFSMKDCASCRGSLNKSSGDGLDIVGRWLLEQWKRRKSGTLYLAEVRNGLLLGDRNLAVNTGLVWIGSNAISSSTLYLGLTDGTPTVAAGDTMASHAGWVEVTAYSNATRQTWTKTGDLQAGFTNSASKASYNMNGSYTTGGAFATTDNTKGGVTGTLVAAVAYTDGDVTGGNGDTVNVQWDLSATG